MKATLSVTPKSDLLKVLDDDSGLDLMGLALLPLQRAIIDIFIA
jgi:hypothetical protein